MDVSEAPVDVPPALADFLDKLGLRMYAPTLMKLGYDDVSAFENFVQVNERRKRNKEGEPSP